MQPRFPKSECDRSCGTNPCLRPICQEFGTLSFHSRCVCAHAVRLGFQLVGIGSFFLGRFGFPCLFFSSNRWILLSDGNFTSLFRRLSSRGDTYRLPCSPSASPHQTRSSNSSKTFSLNTEALKHLWGHRSKCEHLTARSKPPLCVARVVGTLPRDEHTSRGLRRDLRLCLDSTIARVDAKVWIEEKSFDPCVEDIASAKVVSHSSEGVGLTIDVSKAHKRLRIREDGWGRFSFSFGSDNSSANGNMHLLWSALGSTSISSRVSGKSRKERDKALNIIHKVYRQGSRIERADLEGHVGLLMWLADSMQH